MISSCCFGVDTNSIKDPNNEFIKNLRKLTSRSFFTIIKVLVIGKILHTLIRFLNNNDEKLVVLFPKFFTALNRITNSNMIDFVPRGSGEYIEKISNQIIQNRKNGIEVIY